MTLCADTSFLLSLYGADGNTAAATACVQARRSSLHVHWVSAFEFANAVRLREFRGKFTAQEARRIIDLYEKDILAQRVVELPFGPCRYFPGRPGAFSRSYSHSWKSRV